ncbi:Hypothetical protein PAS_chr3_0889 [Komagataella phaffii GS115]|uniref:Uncharacterized protein n=1 Tax=Komagataella phaffii (strain GS115 / ATCC 20864) TaxID=644223 RepID=C4R5W0_KOMPG|nr:Hypothetical protein PAS_chr3_0889 [Komagataella phaffii GS115]AOA63556.1 GQ67_04011T0 [Komagataella phaffii]AOA68603.1 GQ68_03984T0 [Komagataella phaffii GS115]CAY70946.1 Hypothetical protein PAS_chr3_0889 [Komagataella phaffii GS115]
MCYPILRGNLRVRDIQHLANFSKAILRSLAPDVLVHDKRYVLPGGGFNGLSLHLLQLAIELVLFLACSRIIQHPDTPTHIPNYHVLTCAQQKTRNPRLFF